MKKQHHHYGEDVDVSQRWYRPPFASLSVKRVIVPVALLMMFISGTQFSSATYLNGRENQNENVEKQHQKQRMMMKMQEEKEGGLPNTKYLDDRNGRKMGFRTREEREEHYKKLTDKRIINKEQRNQMMRRAKASREAHPDKETEKNMYKSRNQRSIESSRIDFTPFLPQLSTLNSTESAHLVMEQLSSSLKSRMTDMFQSATSAECRAKIGTHVGYFLNTIGKESGSFPFQESKFTNTCPEKWEDLESIPIGERMQRTYQPPRKETEYIENPEDLKLLYGILAHQSPQSTIRLIETLYEEGYTFVIHVDGKESSDETYETLVDYASTREFVHIVPNEYRVRVNWGGFSMVNATMQILQYTFGLLDVDEESDDGKVTKKKVLDGKPLEFHKFVHLSATSYPIASNYEIRHRLASYPLDANFLNVIMRPTNPDPRAWHYFVECDDAVHRIYRLKPLTEKNSGVELYTASQWFIISVEFAEYLARAEAKTLVRDYLEYAEHIVVADEHFFGTLLRNTEFCMKHHNSNFLHLQFDRWESDIDSEDRDQRKCLMPDKNKCGRSPTTLTTDYLPVLELSKDLFARKFSDEADSEIKHLLDIKRANEEKKFRLNGSLQKEVESGVSFEGHGTLIVAKDTIDLTNGEPLCLGLGPNHNKVKLIPCFYEEVLPSLAPGWETGAVIEEEIIPNNRWKVGPCSSDGHLERAENGTMISTPGRYAPGGPSCGIKLFGGARTGRCMDIESEQVRPGGQLQIYPCLHRWHQFFKFGNGLAAPMGSIYASIPDHIVAQIRSKGRQQESYLCFGASGRGGKEEEEWSEDENHFDINGQEFLPDAVKDQAHPIESPLPLDLWKGKQLITTSCHNNNLSVIEFLFVPFIVEDEHDDGDNDGNDETIRNAEAGDDETLNDEDEEF